MKSKLLGLLKDEAGQGMSEYGLIIALVAVVVIAGLTLLGGNLQSTFAGIAAKITGPTP